MNKWNSNHFKNYNIPTTIYSNTSGAYAGKTFGGVEKI